MFLEGMCSVIDIQNFYTYQKKVILIC